MNWLFTLFFSPLDDSIDIQIDVIVLFCELSFDSLRCSELLLIVSVKRQEKRLAVITTSNALSPILWDDIVSKCPFLSTRFFNSQKFDSPYFVVQPIICLDLWEVSNTYLPSNICFLFHHLNKSYMITFVFFSPACLLSGLQGMILSLIGCYILFKD